MTAKDFNKKYEQYLETGHYGLALNNPAVIEYLDNEFKELIKIPGFKYSQIKSKFNWYCFYCEAVPSDRVNQITEKIGQIYKQT